MRWSLIRLIAWRELRDQIRDRRTLFLVFGLPVILYPVFALVGILFAKSMLEQPSLIGVVGSDYLMPRQAREDLPNAMMGGGMVLGQKYVQQPFYPPLILNTTFTYSLGKQAESGGSISLVELTDPDDEGPLIRREVDAILIVPSNLFAALEAEQRPTLTIKAREGDEPSKLAVRRLNRILGSWQTQVKDMRFARAGLPKDYDQVVDIEDPINDKDTLKKTTDELRDTFVKIFPFMLIMWTLAGSLHPAIDMTAGEKERGTMETLLISPAERIEIVTGKFLTTCLASFTTALWNVCWMAGGAMVLSVFMPFAVISIAGLIWCVLLALPLAALFSAVSLALGVYARSVKEGQYYLVPMFIVTMPLCFWAMAPGIQLDLQRSLIPITGMALLQQRLMSVSPGPLPAIYIVNVLGVLILCSLLAVWWAVRQFHRESVLFREAEPLEPRSVFQLLRRRKKAIS